MHSERLIDLLEQTRRALLEGDFDALEVLAQETGAAIDALPGEDTESLDLIRAMADANVGLFEAAARGVAAAKGRLSRPGSFSTYDSRGQRGRVQSDEAGRSRRI
ncbi:flagellar biosynthesis protein FlgN [Pseudogemmobacter bohemicus]|uniref:flagellar biosynthesis protein FlgN n=1 Tax=Pseudogemmobacter bohemicus TaxID=2250708 RepID=UPI000DD2D033|nr:flagellar biosynthesis protein FlgN [Pseudogemmobacter bohemicus]